MDASSDSYCPQSRKTIKILENAVFYGFFEAFEVQCKFLVCEV